MLGNHPIYEWRGQEYKYLTISAMRKCLHRQTLWFIGKQLMRLAICIYIVLLYIIYIYILFLYRYMY